MLRELAGGPLTAETTGTDRSGRGDRGIVLEALDATLGVEGLPQSATGQTALFTGVNAPRLLGRHVPALPGPRLREILACHSVFGKVSRSEGGENGAPSVAFANAFTDERREVYMQGRGRPSASVAATRAGGAVLRDRSQLESGEALSWDVTGRYFGVPLRELRSRTRSSTVQGVGPGVESVSVCSPVDAGRRLVRIAQRHRITLFETFLTDLAGHGRYVVDARTALMAIDGLVQGVVDGAAPELTVVLTSDHGNVEDCSTPMHTSNPVPLLAWGRRAERFAGLGSLLDVAPAVVECLGVE